MKNFSIKSYLKWAIIILAILFLSASIVTRVYLIKNSDRIKDIISQNLTKSLACEVTMGRLNLGLSGRIRLKDLAIYETKGSAQPILKIETIYLKVRLWPLLKKKIAFSYILIDIGQPRIFLLSQPQHQEKLKWLMGRFQSMSMENGLAQAWAISPFLPTVELRAHLEIKTEILKRCLLWSKITIRQDKKGGYKGDGMVSVKEFNFEDRFLNYPLLQLISPRPLYYQFSGQINKDIIQLTKFRGSYGALRLAVKGDIVWSADEPRCDLWLVTNKLDLNLGKMIKGMESAGEAEIKARLYGPLLKPQVKMLLTLDKASLIMPDGSFYINHLAGNIRYTNQVISIENLKGFICDTPLAITGLITNPLVEPQINISIQSYPDQLPGLRPPGALRFATKLKATVTKEISADIENQIYYYADNSKDITTISIGKAVLKVPEDIETWLSPDLELPVTVESLSIQTQNNHLSINSLKFMVVYNGKKIYLKDITGQLYQGQLNTHILFDLTKPRLQVSGHFDLKDVVLDEILKKLKINSKVSGLLDGHADLLLDRSGMTGLQGSGWLRINNGNISDIPLLASLAEVTGIGALRDMKFDTIIIDYRLADRAISIENFILNSPQTNIQGKGRFDAQARVKGNITARFSKDSLERSSKLKLAVWFLGNRCQELDFNFQVFGSFSSPRFQWLPGQFRENLQSLLTRKQERQIDESIEEMIESLQK